MGAREELEVLDEEMLEVRLKHHPLHSRPDLDDAFEGCDGVAEESEEVSEAVQVLEVKEVRSPPSHLRMPRPA